MAANEINIEKFFLILRTHARLIISIFIVAVALAVVITYVTPKRYTAKTSLNFVFSPNPVDSRGNSELDGSGYINTQMVIIKSQQVAHKVESSLTEYERQRLIAALKARRSVIDELKSRLMSHIRSLFHKKDNPVHETSNGQTLNINSAYGWLAQSLGGDLSVEPKLNSRVVEVSYISTDPQVAALMVNKFAEAYIATNLEMVTDPAQQSKVWFDEQLKSLRTRLEESQARLTTYQQEEKVVSADERLGTETSRLQTLSNQLIEAQQTTRKAITERQKLKEVLASGASLTTFKPVFSNPVVQSIKGEIRGLEATLVKSSDSLGVNHPRIKKINSELYAARQRLKSEIQTITEGINNAAELSKEREHDLQKALAAQKQLVLNLKHQHNRIAVFQREVDSAQTTYNTALGALNTTSMQSMIDQTNVSIIDHANIPGSPSSPNMTMNVALGVLGGLLFGIGLAVIMEISIRRVHSKEDLTFELGVPLLAHLKKV